MIHPILNAKTNISDITEASKQPNAVDLILEKVFIFTSDDFYTDVDPFILDEDKKTHRKQAEIRPHRDGYFRLQPGYYVIQYRNEIEVAEGEAGWVISRSTLIRNGVYLLTGLYDSGYTGKMMGGLHVTSGDFLVKPGTRIGQYLCFNATSAHLYDGDYQERKS